MQRMVKPPEPRRDAEKLRRQRGRSLAIALTLGALVVIFYAATIVRLGPNAVNRDARAVRTGTSVVVPEGTGAVADCKKAGTC